MRKKEITKFLLFSMLVFYFVIMFWLMIQKNYESTWKSKQLLEIHLVAEDSLEEMIEEIKANKSDEYILYQNGLKVTGVIDEKDFEYLCEGFNSPILDMAEAVYIEKDIKCDFSDNPPYSKVSKVKIILMPKAYYGSYSVPGGLFALMEELEYADIRYVDNVKKEMFYRTGIVEVVFPEEYILEAVFGKTSSLKELDISGATEINLDGFTESSIKKIIILKTFPPKLSGDFYNINENSKQMTIVIPNSSSWDAFEQELKGRGYEGKFERVPYENDEKLLVMHLEEGERLRDKYYEVFDRENYLNGIKITGTIDDEDFKFACEVFDQAVLDLSEAVFIGEEISCKLKNKINIKEIMLPQAQDKNYNLPESFLRNMKELDIVDISNVGYIGKGTFSNSSVNKIIFSDSFRLGEGAFEGMIFPIKIDISGVYEIERTAFNESNIELITIMSKEPPEIKAERSIGFELPEYTIFVYPDTEEWDGFEQVLRENGYIGLIRRDPFEE